MVSELIEEIQARAAEQLEFAEAPDRERELASCKRYLKDEGARLKKLHRGGGLGREVCEVRAAVIDALIMQLFKTAMNRAPLGKSKKPPAITVVD